MKNRLITGLERIVYSPTKATVGVEVIMNQSLHLIQSNSRDGLIVVS